MAGSRMFTPQTIKRFTSVHSWVGIFTGMALFIAFFAGALTMYAGPMHLWANPELRRTSGSMADVQKLVDTVSREAGATNFSVAFADGTKPTARFFGGGRGGGRSFTENVRMVDAQANIVPRKSISGVERWINEIHYTIGLPKHPGFTLMGIVSAVYFLALVTGLIVHLPHLLGDLYALRTGKNLKKMWLDAHNAIGILSLPFHLMFAFTGFLICIIFMIPPLMEKVTPTGEAATAFRQTSAFGGGGGHGFGRGEAPPAPPAAMLPASRIVATATSRVAGFEPTGISYSDYGTQRAKATVEGEFRTAIVSRGSVEVSPIDGSLGKIDAPQGRSTASALEQGYMFLHYGDYGGQIMRAVYFVLGLGGAFLFYSGNLLWIETRRKRRHVEQVMSGWIMAKITIGICLGCCLGIAASLWGVRLLPEWLADRGRWERDLYYIGFFGSVIWAGARPPIRAGVELLFVLAFAYAALPVLNVMLTPENLAFSLTHGLWDVALIDIIFGGMGVGFFAMARATLHRARTGQPNSVWALVSRPEAPKRDAAEPPHPSARPQPVNA